MRRERRAVLVNCHRAASHANGECHREDLIVFECNRSSSNRRSVRVVAGKKLRKIEVESQICQLDVQNFINKQSEVSEQLKKRNVAILRVGNDAYLAPK